MKGDLEGAKEWLGAWEKQVSTSVKDHLKRVKELQESRKQRGLKENRGYRTGLLEMDRLGDDKDNSSNLELYWLWYMHDWLHLPIRSMEGAANCRWFIVEC